VQYNGPLWGGNLEAIQAHRLVAVAIKYK